MGTWGPGNFDNDYALDELSARVHELVTSLLLRAQRKESREYDEYDYTTLFVDFEMVFLLDSAKRLQGGSKTFPDPARVRALAQSFIADWEAYDEDQADPERRKVILESFERFAQICEAQGGKGPLPKPAKAKKKSG